MSRLAPTRRPVVHPKSSKPAPAGIRKPIAPTGRVGTSAKSSTEDGYLYLAGVRDASKRITEFRAESDQCPICHTDRQFQKDLRLLVSPCYHKLCESCIERIYRDGPSPCPTCGKILRKFNFAHQTFEDLRVEKEVAVRRRMAEYFNKREEDFSSPREYDDYLEMVEELTFNLLNDVDVDATEKRILDYAKRNAKSIATNQEKLAIESLSQTERDDLEKRAREERMRMVEDGERMERIEEDRMRAAVVDALASGNKSKADTIRQDYELAKLARSEAISKALPASLVAVTGDEDSSKQHEPGSPHYHGPFVPYPYGSMDDMPWKSWYSLKSDYQDNRSGVLMVKEDKEGKVRGGGFDLNLFWEMEIRAAVESLGVEPLVD